jgi:hypothetical protein
MHNHRLSRHTGPRMIRVTTRVLVCLAASAVCVAGAHAATQHDPNSKQQKVYKWVDEKGVVHYGDAVPPQYADQDKTILNAQGVAVGSIPGKRTPEQLAAEAAQHKADERTRETALQSRQRDQNLLATYLSVEEIEALRDRRAEILDAQARVTSQYLEQLRGHQKQLEEQALHFKPYNTAPNAAQLPERLAEDLVHTTSDLATQQRNLDVKRQELEKLKAQFTSDIARFKELKRIESEYNGGASAPHN